MRTPLLFVASLLLANSVISQDVSELENFEKAMKPGTILNYEVKMGKVQYQLSVTIKSLGNEIIYEWETSTPSNKKGSVKMTADAINNATALFHVFENGAVHLDNQTSLWLSKKIQSDVGANAEALIKMNGATDTATLMSNTISEVGMLLDGNFITVPGWELEGGGDIKMLVGAVESVKFPLIYRLENGWTLLLTEIKSK